MQTVTTDRQTSIVVGRIRLSDNTTVQTATTDRQTSIAVGRIRLSDNTAVQTDRLTKRQTDLHCRR